MSVNLSDDKSKLDQVMDWCYQATTGVNVYPDLCRHVASLGQNEFNDGGLLWIYLKKK